MFGLGPAEMIIVGVVAVLLFGSRLPSVARSLGKSMSEFKRGLHDIESEVQSATSDRQSRVSYSAPASYEEPTAPKFEPPKSESIDEREATSK